MYGDAGENKISWKSYGIRTTIRSSSHEKSQSLKRSRILEGNEHEFE